jgi:hypothetical protein
LVGALWWVSTLAAGGPELQGSPPGTRLVVFCLQRSLLHEGKGHAGGGD